MDADTMTALRGSEDKWINIAFAGGEDRGALNCPLCQKFLKGNGSCGGCPVAEKIGMSHCRGTPYEEWAEKVRPSLAGRFAETPAERELALRERDFLRDLRLEAEAEDAKAATKESETAIASKELPPVSNIRAWEPGIKANEGDLLVRLSKSASKTICLIAVDADGDKLLCGNLLFIRPEGLTRATSVGPDVRMKKDANGRLLMIGE